MKNPSRRFLAAASVAALMAFSAPAFAADTSTLSKEIDKVARDAIAAGESPGLEIAVYKDGRPVLVKSYGLANIELKVPVTNNDVFRIGSITKQFTAAALLQLAEEGKLSVDDKLSKYYPNFPRANDITLAEILHHTSGIHNYTAVKGYMEKDGLVHQTTDEMMTYIAKMDKTQDFEPGASWNYSNSGFFILGAIVEKVSGQPLATVLKTRLFDPVGMTHTALDDETQIVPGRAAGYAGDGPGHFTNAGFISMTVPGGAGAIRSTAEDLAKWNAALYGGKVLKPASLTAMTTPGKLNDGQPSSTAMAKQKNFPKNVEYGYGLMLSNEDGHPKVSHGGGIPGFNSSLSNFPKDHVTVVVLANSIGKDVGAGAVADRIERIAIGLPPKTEKSDKS